MRPPRPNARASSRRPDARTSGSDHAFDRRSPDRRAASVRITPRASSCLDRLTSVPGRNDSAVRSGNRPTWDDSQRVCPVLGAAVTIAFDQWTMVFATACSPTTTSEPPSMRKLTREAPGQPRSPALPYSRPRLPCLRTSFAVSAAGICSTWRAAPVTGFRTTSGTAPASRCSTNPTNVGGM